MSEKEIEQPQPQEGGITAILDAYIPDGLITQFASGFSIAKTGNEVYLSFLQPELPVVPDQGQKGVSLVKHKCVARIIVTPAGLNVLADLLNKSK